MALLPLLLTGAADRAASQNGPGVPVLGLAYDADLGAIRPILGMPGAAVFGDAIGFGFPIAAAAISPRNNLALAVSAGDQSVRVVQFQSGAPSAIALNGAMPSPSQMTFSPSGSAALLYQQTSRGLQLVTGLPGNPSVQDVFTGGVPGTAAPAAISDDGRLILFTSPNQSGGQVWLLPVDGSPMLLPFPGSILSFRPQSRDAIAATPAGDVYLVRDVTVSADYKQIGAGGGTSSPVAVSFSPDGALGYVAASSGTLTVFDLAGGASNSVDCQCVPALLQPLSTASMFRISEISGAPVLLFEGSATAPRTWFVPAAPVPESGRPRAHRGGGR